MKWIKSVTAVIVVALVLVTINFISGNSTSTTGDESTIVDTEVFPHNKVVDVNIEIDEDTYQDMLDNATAEEIVMADITYNGETFKNIGIRPKGNSSLRDVASSDSDRYSFKVDFNYYIDDQSFDGITKINLNNIFSDPSMMAEYLGYEMLDELDVDSPRTTYVALSINGEYYGLYLAAEQVNDSFLIDHYGSDSGELYKPDSGVGADLAYISDDGADYTGLYPENMDESDNEALVELIKTINDGGDLDSIFDVDSFLKYLAVSTMTVHLDSYQGGMFHNYYLYNNDGIFEWIPWDLNMIFNGFPGSGLTDTEAIGFLIDEPVKGSMENYPLVQAIFENEEYVAKYHEYLETLSEGYLSADNFEEKVLSVSEMIDSYVETDPSSFYTYGEFQSALYQEDGVGLLSFVEKRVENVAQQLSGEIPSTNNGEGNSGTSGMGGNKMAGGDRAMPTDTTNSEIPEAVDGEIPEVVDGEMPETVDGEMQRPAPVDGEIPETVDGQTPETVDGEMPEAVDGQMQRPAQGDGQMQRPAPVDGEIPETVDGQTPETVDGEMPEAVDGEMPEAVDGQMGPGMQDQATNQMDQQTAEDTTATTETAKMSTNEIVVIVGMSFLLILASVFLSRKH
ncbi:MAG: CotH kinase family protein [Clostridiaceae bacterium]